MAARKGIRGKCQKAGKTSFTTYERADAARNPRKDEGHTYFCTTCGGYHVSRYSEVEYLHRKQDYMLG